MSENPSLVFPDTADRGHFTDSYLVTLLTQSTSRMTFEKFSLVRFHLM